MTENQTPKDENSQETMNSGKLETVQNIDSNILPQDNNVIDSTTEVEETATPANASAQSGVTSSARGRATTVASKRIHTDDIYNATL